MANIVATLAAELENTVGTAGFETAFAKINNLSAADTQALSRKFAGRVVRSAAQAKKFIWARHQGLLNDDAMAAHTNGHIAA